jgi:hypothetical protein
MSERLGVSHTDLTRILPPIRSRCKFTPEELCYHMERNLEQQLPDLYALQNEYRGECIVLAGGPSVDSHWQTLLHLWDKKTPLLSISRMVPKVVAEKLRPDFVIAMDSSEAQLAGFEQTYPVTKYLLSTVTNADAVQKVVDDGRDAYIFDSFTDEAVRRKRAATGYRVATALNAGGSVAVAAISAAMLLGFTTLHVFGCDYMVTDPKVHHATGIAGESSPEQFFPLEIEGKQYITSCPYIEFANQTADLLRAGKATGLLHSAKFYGDSLVNAIWRESDV